MAAAGKISRKVKLSSDEILITRDEGTSRIGFNIRRRENVNWHYITLSAADVKTLITELLGTL